VVDILPGMKRNLRPMRRASVAVLVLGSAATLAACAEDGASASEQTTADAGATSTAATSTGVVVPVVALDNTFRPQTVEVHVGDTVSWENRGNNDHDVLSVETGKWGAEVTDFAPGDVYTHVFTEPGDYAYYCSIHGSAHAGMTGTITVKP
jgi:plastocyanin